MKRVVKSYNIPDEISIKESESDFIYGVFMDYNKINKDKGSQLEICLIKYGYSVDLLDNTDYDDGMYYYLESLRCGDKFEGKYPSLKYILEDLLSNPAMMVVQFDNIWDFLQWSEEVIKYASRRYGMRETEFGTYYRTYLKEGEGVDGGCCCGTDNVCCSDDIDGGVEDCCDCDCEEETVRNIPEIDYEYLKDLIKCTEQENKSNIQKSTTGDKLGCYPPHRAETQKDYFGIDDVYAYDNGMSSLKDKSQDEPNNFSEKRKNIEDILKNYKRK